MTGFFCEKAVSEKLAFLCVLTGGRKVSTFELGGSPEGQGAIIRGESLFGGVQALCSGLFPQGSASPSGGAPAAAGRLPGARLPTVRPPYRPRAPAGGGRRVPRRRGGPPRPDGLHRGPDGDGRGDETPPARCWRAAPKDSTQLGLWRTPEYLEA